MEEALLPKEGRFALPFKGALTSSYDSGELYGASIEADGVKVGSGRAGTPTSVEDFTGNLLAVGDEAGVEAILNCHFVGASPPFAHDC
ncbi:hypothetical protein Nepgr_009514 [Nepenthes gracilis]|uniref:Uncharacterized protein n=1 Tax=Nepenthes gracilis TaxID=150966 RepID=A0AAD3SBI9_NEPGR|nr:hypothetical protein Nepgr_009514 [Nepenthes gracilis]